MFSKFSACLETAHLNSLLLIWSPSGSFGRLSTLKYKINNKITFSKFSGFLEFTHLSLSRSEPQLVYTSSSARLGQDLCFPRPVPQLLLKTSTKAYPKDQHRIKVQHHRSPRSAPQLAQTSVSACPDQHHDSFQTRTSAPLIYQHQLASQIASACLKDQHLSSF